MKDIEAIYGFMAWLTTRDEVVSFGGSEECSTAVELITQFAEANNLGDVSADYPEMITFPEAASKAA